MESNTIKFISSDSDYTPNQCFENAIDLALFEKGEHQIAFGVALRQLTCGYELYFHYVTIIDGELTESNLGDFSKTEHFLPIHIWSIDEYILERDQDFDEKGGSDTNYLSGIISNNRGIKARIKKFFNQNKTKGSKPAFSDSGSVHQLFTENLEFTGVPRFGKTINLRNKK